MENGLLGFAGQGPAIDLDPNTQLFTSSGVWTKPADCQWVRIIIVGGGGGGGGGSRGDVSVSGGYGGAGGGMSFIDIPAGVLPSTVPVTIGAGGSAGTGQTAAAAKTSGGNGGTTTFGDILSAEGGQHANTSNGGRGHFIGAACSAFFFGNPWANQTIFTSGGGQGGCPASHGQDIGLTVAAQAGSARSPFTEPQKYGVLGQGGHGGGQNTFGTALHEPSAGTFGNGGGGGGASRTTGNGQNGKVGGDGYCLVVSYGSAVKPINVQEFKTNGTWSKPTDPRLSQARVFAIGGGGGGGSGRRWNRNNGAYLTGSRLALSAASSNSYASAPDSASLSITGDIDIRAKINLQSWSESDNVWSGANTAWRYVVSKWNATGNQRSYYLGFYSYGIIGLGWSNNGTAELLTQSDAFVNFEPNTTKWIRATMDVDNGSSQRVTKFYTSDDGSSWTQLGATITTSGATSIFDSTATLAIGALTAGSGTGKFEGSVYQASVTNGYDGAGTVQFDANFETAAEGAASFTESSANAATVTITNGATNNAGGGGGGGGGVSYSEIPLGILPSAVSVTAGTGGVGGAGVTEDYMYGNHGGFGGNSTFGDYVSAMGGHRGHGGSSVTGSIATSRIGSQWGSTLNLNYPYISGTLTGGSGSGVGSATGAGGTANMTGFLGCFMTGGGGGGGGISSANATGAGGVSTKSLGYETIQSNTAAATDGVAIYDNVAGMFGGSGGGGGSSNGTVNGGNGGRGSGGGGGAATTTGTTSGAGGNGGDGYVLVICV